MNVEITQSYQSLCWGRARVTFNVDGGERQGPLQRMEGDGKSPSVKRKVKWSEGFLLDLAQLPAKGRGGALSALTQERMVQASLQHLCYEYQRRDKRKGATINRVCMCIRERKHTRKSEKLV